MLNGWWPRSPKVMINTSYVFLLSGYRKMVTDRDDDPFEWWRTLKDQSKDKSNQLFGSQVVRDLEKYGTVHKFASDSEFSKQKSNVRAEKMARWLDGALHSHRLITSGSPRMGNLQCRDLDSNYYSWVARGVTKNQTKKLSILLSFYFHEVL